MNKQEFAYFLSTITEKSKHSKTSLIDYLNNIVTLIKNSILNERISWESVCQIIINAFYYDKQKNQKLLENKSEIFKSIPIERGYRKEIIFSSSFKGVLNQNNYQDHLVEANLIGFSDSTGKWEYLESYEYFENPKLAELWLKKYYLFYSIRKKNEGENIFYVDKQFEHELEKILREYYFFKYGRYSSGIYCLDSELFHAGKPELFPLYCEFLFHCAYLREPQNSLFKTISKMSGWFNFFFYSENCVEYWEESCSLEFLYLIFLESFKKEDYYGGMEPWRYLMAQDKYAYLQKSPVSSESINQFERYYHLSFPNDLKLFYFDHAEFITSNKYLEVSLFYPDNPDHSIDEIQVGPFYSLDYLDPVYPLFKEKEEEYQMWLNMEPIMQNTYPYATFQGGNPIKKEIYYVIGESDKGLILVGNGLENKNQIFLRISVSEEYNNPQWIAASFSELLQRCYTK